MRIEPLAASSHLHTTSSGLPVVYDAEALETYFSTPDGAEALTGRLGKLARVTSGLGVRVGTTFLALLAGLAPPSVGPTALEDALAASPVREAFEELGPTFVKFGQALGSRPDLAGERLALQLRALQAEMAPFATADARAVIQAEFGEVAAAPLLRALPATPAAAASIGQVYKVQLPRGRRSLRRGLRRPPPQTLAVKVLRPDARAAVAADAVLARRAAGALESLRAWRAAAGASGAGGCGRRVLLSTIRGDGLRARGGKHRRVQRGLRAPDRGAAAAGPRRRDRAARRVLAVVRGAGESPRPRVN